MTRLRLLYSSNILGCASGYGTQGVSLLPRLAELPEFGGQPGSLEGRKNIAQFAWYGLHGLKMNYQGFEIYPGFDDPYGNDVIGAHTQHFGANWVVPLIDAWVLQNTAQAVAPALFTPWLPIDHTPTPDAVLKGIQGAHMPLTYSKWGHAQLAAEGVPNHYIPHGVETGVFKVLDDRETVRRFKRDLTGVDDAFLCVMVAANKGFPDRKWFQGQLEVFRDFAKDKPEARLYIHSLPTQHHGGINFEEFAKRLNLHGKLIFPNPYLYRLGYPPEYLAMVYNAADVLLSCSMSEGFGIPIVEAQAAGTPVLVTNFSAMPELVRWGHVVDVADYVLTPMMSYQAWPSKRDMLDKLTRLYEAWLVCGGEWPLARRAKCSAEIHAEYDWDAIVRDQWAPFVTQIAEAAPPLGKRFGGVDMRQDVGGFVDALQEGLEAERAVPRMARRVAPLTNGHATYEAVSDEEAQVPA
jgi:glycosyltransferase involved in cell wall biosynthesis